MSKPKRSINFRILTGDYKVVPIDSDVSALVGTVDAVEAKRLMLGIILSGKLSKQENKSLLYMILRNNPSLWEYLESVRTSLDDRGIE